MHFLTRYTRNVILDLHIMAVIAILALVKFNIANDNRGPLASVG